MACEILTIDEIMTISPELEIIDLQLQNHQRFVKIVPGTKRVQGYWKNQSDRHFLSSITTPHIGLINGNELLSVDFDGDQAVEDHKILFPTHPLQSTSSPTHSSLKAPNHYQTLYIVPEELRPFILNKTLSQSGKLEFRYNQHLSVLPPTVHKTTGLPIQWLVNPLENLIQELPIEYQVFLIEEFTKVNDKTLYDTVDLNTTVDEHKFFDTLVFIKENLSHLHYQLRRDIMWSTISVYGKAEAHNIMQNLWAEQNNWNNSYKMIISAYQPGHTGAGKVFGIAKGLRNKKWN